MNNKEKLFAKLGVLRAKGRLPKSQCSKSFLHLVNPLRATAVIVEQRSGSGRELIVRNLDALAKFIDHNFPANDSPSDLPSRVIGLHRFRDTKIFPNDSPFIVQVRAWCRDILRKNGESVDAEIKTRLHSVFSFQITPDYTLHGPCALAENPTIFSLFERLELNIRLVIYGQGRVSRHLLSWLRSQSHPEFSLLHLPDYDPVGLSEFERLRSALGPRVRLHIPKDLNELFARYSNRDLLGRVRSRALLSNLRRSDCPELLRIIQLIDRHNAGLEQESLLVGLPAHGTTPAQA